MFDRNSTNSLKGICMLMIIIHHIYTNLGYVNSYIRNFGLGSWGYIATGTFFLLSGYGLTSSVQKQKIENKDWLFKRLKKILLPYGFVFVLYTTLQFILEDSVLSFSVLKNFISLTVPGTTTWFLKVITVLYILFYIIFRSNRSILQKITIMTLFCVLYLIVAIPFLPDFWWSSILCFPVGMISSYLASKNKGAISDYINCRVFSLRTILFDTIFILTSLLIWKKLDHFYYLRIAISITSTFSLLTFFKYVQSNSRILNYISKHSINFYLFQFLFLHFAKPFAGQWSDYGIIVFSGTFLLSLVYSKFFEFTFHH